MVRVEGKEPFCTRPPPRFVDPTVSETTARGEKEAEGGPGGGRTEILAQRAWNIVAQEGKRISSFKESRYAGCFRSIVSQGCESQRRTPRMIKDNFPVNVTRVRYIYAARQFGC
ncbi:hypothetical protein KM043_010603 [Ampulex compressa]|nr:hypothetical protein KM043_010603 [Ampulex compressa]